MRRICEMQNDRKAQKALRSFCVCRAGHTEGRFAVAKRHSHDGGGVPVGVASQPVAAAVAAQTAPKSVISCRRFAYNWIKCVNCLLKSPFFAIINLNIRAGCASGQNKALGFALRPRATRRRRRCECGRFFTRPADAMPLRRYIWDGFSTGRGVMPRASSAKEIP